MGLRFTTVDLVTVASWNAVIDKHNIERATIVVQTETFLTIRRGAHSVSLVIQGPFQERQQGIAIFN